MRLFLDTSILLFAVGTPHPHREPCRKILDAATRGDVELHVSLEAVQEILFHRLRHDSRTEAVEFARDVMTLSHTHAVDTAVMARAFELTLTSPIRGRDAIHAATALIHGFTSIITADNDFPQVAGLTPVSPPDGALLVTP